MSIPVLYAGRGFFAVNKPAGITVIPGRGEEREPSLRERLEEERGEKLFVVHRLDRDTSGVLLFATTAEAHRALSMAFEAGRVDKRYRALCEGALRETRDVQVPLAPARKGRMRPAVPGEDGKDARTIFRPLENFGDRATLVEAEPLTGRTHQIRVHLKSIGHPLLFDHQYGRKQPVLERELGGVTDAPVLSRTPLHASRLVLRGIEGVEDAEIEAPLAPDMEQALAMLRHMSNAEVP